VLSALLGAPELVWAHGASGEKFRPVIDSVTPSKLPVEVEIRGDRMRVVNDGDELLVICNGAEGACVGREVRGGDTALVQEERLHWQGGEDTLPKGVDVNDSAAQQVVDVEIPIRYGDRDGTIEAHIDYVGGQSWLQRYGEYALVALAVLVMLGVFVVDARRRRADIGPRGRDADASAADSAAADEDSA
jgi:hypothetical protein